MEKILNYMQKQKLKQQITTPTTIKNSLIDHIWSNIPGIDNQYGVTDAYWLDYHKPIYCAFKLPNTLPNTLPKPFVLYDHESLMLPNSYEDHESLMTMNP
jgi:hypothetical protein